MFLKDKSQTSRVNYKIQQNLCKKLLRKTKKLYFESLNPVQDGRGQKSPPTSFSPVTSTNVGIRSQNFLTFSFNLFDGLL